MQTRGKLWMLLAWLVAMGGRAEPVQMVKIVELDGQATYELMPLTKAKSLQAEINREGRFFAQAMAQAKEEWKKNPRQAGKPFPTLPVRPRKFSAIGVPRKDDEKAKAELAKLADKEWDRRFKESAAAPAGATKAEEQEEAMGLFDGIFRQLCGKQSAEAGSPPLSPMAAVSEPASPAIQGTAVAEGGTNWVEAMKALHTGFAGTAGYVAQFGDSITYSMAFWKPFSWSDPDEYLPEDGLPTRPTEKRWRDTILGAGNEGKEAVAGNYSGWTAADLLGAVPGVLERNKPEAAIVMIGTNDARDNTLRPTYAEELAKIVELCLAAHCIPILSTIPPQRGCPDSVAAANQAIRALAASKNLPLVDYHAAILERAPDGKWDGTLISEDGRHPSGGENNTFTPENLAKCGFALRNYVTFLKYREVFFRVLHPEQAGRP